MAATSLPTSLRTDIAWSDAGAIHVHGYNLCEDLLGRINFGDMAFLEISGRLPDLNESRMFNAVLLTCVEHGIVPSTLAARMTYAGAPEAMQAAVAAGLLGLGSVFVGSAEGAAQLLSTSLASRDGQDTDVKELAHRIVKAQRAQKKLIPGLGHPVHKLVDPRTVRLFAIARETGFHGQYVKLVNAIGEAATREFAKPMPVNATGAIGAICCEMGFEWRVSRGIGVMARAVGLVGHILEESRQPMAIELWHRAEDEATMHFRTAAATPAVNAADAPALREPSDVLALYQRHGGTLSSMLESRETALSDKEFLVFEGRSYTYRAVRDEARRFAIALALKGVGAGDRVGLVSANHPSSVFLLFALASLEAVMVPVNPDYGVEEVRYILNHAEVKGVICEVGTAETVQTACAPIQPAPWILLNATPADSGVEASLPAITEMTEGETASAFAARDCPDASCVFIYTSGTTGFPKGVMHSQRSLLTVAEGFVARMHLQPEDRLLCILPLFHVNAIFYSMGGALAAGATLILEPRFSASRFWTVVKETGATEVNTIAAATSILMRRPRSEYVPGHRLQKMYGAPFTQETYRVYNEEFHLRTLIEGYGMSEIPGVLNNPFHGPHKVGSMGKVSRHPNPRVPIAEAVIAGEDGRILPRGQVGELMVKTPVVMQGYFRDPEQTASAFRDGWFLTGDLAYQDEDDYFWFVARQKDIIRKRGENISGAELDRVIEAHPSVLEAAAIPVPSELGEDDILVAIVLRPGMALSPDDLSRWCRERLAAVKIPRFLTIVEALPHTATHRIAKFKLREDPAILKGAVQVTAGGA